MNTVYPHKKDKRVALRTLAIVLVGLLSIQVLGGCASRQSYAPPRPVDDTARGTQTYPAARNNQPQARKGLSTGQKVAILAGAAGLYYLYNQHKNRQEQGPQGKYYLSKNGRVYYRDAEGRAHWVTPPAEGIRVPEEQAQAYRDFQGYNNKPEGRTLIGLGGDKQSVQ